MKNKETLEEFAERMAVKENKSSLFELAKKYIVLGAKWQQERMYSEEDLDAFRKFMIQEQNFSKSCLDVFVKQLKNK
jgi:hypothetical protein